jgi:hypothetical protein
MNSIHITRRPSDPQCGAVSGEPCYDTPFQMAPLGDDPSPSAEPLCRKRAALIRDGLVSFAGIPRNPAEASQVDQLIEALRTRSPDDRYCCGIPGFFFGWGTWTRTKNNGTRNRRVANYTIPQWPKPKLRADMQL